jgi:acyl transferase domain-containing protein
MRDPIQADFMEDSADIAIIGMSGSFPGAHNIEELWQNIRDGVESITQFSDEELLQAGVDPELLRDPTYVKAGPVLADIDLFDAAFFRFTPKEAQVIDPQQRLFIECAWNAIENAGYNVETYNGPIGLFAGSSLSTYLLNNIYPNQEVMDSSGMIQVVLGNDKDSLATRVAYLLNLTGPCYSVQTYCSTSLVATCIACSSLLNGECDMALAGGVYVSAQQKTGYLYQEGGISSPDGRCRAFDADAQGAPLGSGVGIVVLKRLTDALRDGDTIHAVIKGSAINNDGSLKVGFTAPGVRGQAAVITEALANADVEAESIDYIEAHGTGTALGDAIELSALLKAFGEQTQKKHFCALGSVKTNVGHLDRAAGVTGLIKTTMALKHGMIPPSLNYQQPNRQVSLDESPFYVNTQLKEWKREHGARRAGVSAFGMGGTNAHVVLEEAAPVSIAPSQRPYHLLPISARTEQALDVAANNLRIYLQQHAESQLADVAHTLQVGRKAFERRRFLVAHDRQAALQSLTDPNQRGLASNAPCLPERPVAFLFPGLGEHYQETLRELYRQEPAFRESVDQCCALLKKRAGLDLLETLKLTGDDAPQKTRLGGDLRSWLGRDTPPAALDESQQTAIAQPALFVFEYALAQLFQQWGIQPQAMIGYSLSEYVVACLAGVFSLEDALYLVGQRAQLIQHIERGAMLAVPLSQESVQPYLSQQISLAVVSSANTCVLSGPLDAVAELEQQLSEDGIVSRRLEAMHAFHSHMLDPLQRTLTDLVRMVTLHEPQIPYLSNVTGTWITAEQATDPSYWAQHMCQTVNFSSGMQELLQDTDLLLLEVGPGQSLSSFFKQQPDCTRERMELIVATLPAAYEQTPALACLLNALGKAWVTGVSVNWEGIYANERRQRISLPTYPFERQRYWIDPPQQKSNASLALSVPQKRKAPADWFYVPTWKEAPLASNKLPSGIGRALVCMDDYGIGSQIATQLERAGALVIRVQIGAHFARSAEHTFQVRPDHPGDYNQLFRALSSSGMLPQFIYHLWSVTESTPASSDKKTQFAALQDRGFYSLLFLVQALDAYDYDDAVQLFAVTNHAQALNDQDILSPEKATILAVARVIAQENLDIHCRCIDIQATEASDGYAQLAGQLIAEKDAPSTETMIAYREQTRWIQDYSPKRLETTTTPLRQEGVYLITGGLGSVGLALAEYLARQFKARLVLLGRSSLPERGMWADWLNAHDEDDAVSKKIQRLQLLEALGAEVLLLQADIANSDQVQGVLSQVEARFGALHGVFHAAGLTTPDTFKTTLELRRKDCEQHFQSKVYGLLALEEALRERELDFCLLFSSISTVLGGIGFAAYSAANTFMDAFSQHYNRHASFPWISVNWDTWLVASSQGQGILQGQTIAEYSMTPEEGIQALLHILASKETRVVNSTGDLHARIRQWVNMEEISQGKQARDKSQESAAAAPPEQGDIESKLTAIWQEILGIESIGRNDNFFDIGGNSLIGLQLIARIKKAFRVQISAVALFEAPTLSAMVSYLQPQQKVQAGGEQQLLTTRRMQARKSTASTDIAIIGMTGRFPGATSVEQFWQNLCAGTESITFFSDEELLAAGVDPQLLHEPNYVKARPVLDDIEHFDAAFFGYSPREAEVMDPQHRLFMECAWEALELAGYDVQRYKGLIGVFGGANLSTYLLSFIGDPQVMRVINDYQMVIGTDKDSLTTAVSYKLNLKGPSYAVQTFCSTSLVAAHLACQHLLNGECDMALAGGVSIRVPAVNGHLWQEGGMESHDGHCRTFDAQANGSMFGDGVGIVVLKRLADALEDGDTVHAVIKGSALNNDGSLKVSYTAPSVVGQADVVVEALARANVTADTISYVEAHGTATELGDPIEVTSLTKAFRTHTERKGYCAIGSVKTNIGHLDRAAGVSGLIKTALALKHGQIPPSLHFEAPNPEIDFENSPFYVNTRLSEWRTDGMVRRAGLNSLGMGGTNVHMILEEAPPTVHSSPGRARHLLLLSARTETALETASDNLHAYLEQHPDVSLADVAYTLQLGRTIFEQRRMLTCTNVAEAIELLTNRKPQSVIDRIESNKERTVAFMFPGLGEQYIGMAQELYQEEPIFKQAVDRCSELLMSHLDVDLRGILYPTDLSKTQGHAATALDMRTLLARPAAASAGQLKQTALAQPTMFMIEYALAQLLIQWGIQPQAMIGYSLGEYVAACLAGVLTLEDALLLVARRAQLIQSLPAGGMLAVALSQAAVQPYLTEQVSLAVINGPLMSVLAGPYDTLNNVKSQLEAQGIATRSLETTHAFHSTMLESIREDLTDLVKQVILREPQIPYISNVTGTWITAEQATDPAYWAQHMCQTVHFAAGIEQILQDPHLLLLEVGPGQSLGSFVRQHPACNRERMSLILGTLPAAFEQQSALDNLLTSVGRLWLTGVQVDWQGFYRGERRQRLTLPTYPFERQRYWIKGQSGIQRTQKKAGSTANAVGTANSLEEAVSQHPREQLSDWFYLPGWKSSVAYTGWQGTATDAGDWLIFADASGLGAQLQAQIRAHQQQTVIVQPATDFARIGVGSYTINPGLRSDYEALFKALTVDGYRPAHALHLWTLTPEQQEQCQGDAELLERGLYSLINLVQAWQEHDGDSQRQITIITNHTQDVTGDEQIIPEKATVVGPCRVIPLEYPTIRCHSIDICQPCAGSKQEKLLLEQLLGEITCNETEAVVALRGKHRWLQTFERAPLHEPQEQATRLRTEGVYLITGGLGGIGLAMAEHLAQRVQAKLALVGRTGLPARSQWEHILQTQGSDTELGRKINKVLELEKLGSKVLLLQADVAEEQQMQAVIQKTITTFGALHGVIHAAGVPAIGLTQLKTRKDVASVIAPKVQGTLALQRALEDAPVLDFLVLFSSITSFTGGGPGQIDYCAANAFLDAFAARHSERHGRTLAINWGEWQWNAWSAGLAGYDEHTQTFFKANRQRFGISFTEGAAALERILASNLSQVVASTQDFLAIVQLSKTFTAANMLQRARETRQAQVSHPRPTLGASYIAPRNEMERKITAIWEELLGIAQIGIDDNFFELGGNSLVGVDLINHLRKEFQLASIPTYVLYEAPTASAMANHLEQASAKDTPVNVSVDQRLARGERRREGLQQRVRETRRTR